MTRQSPVKFTQCEMPTTLECPKCGGCNLIILGATSFERSSDRLSVRTTEIGSGRPFVWEQAAGGSKNPSPLSDAITLHLGCFFCTGREVDKALTLAVFEARGQIELAWIDGQSADDDAEPE